MQKTNITFIGAGNMGSCLINGLITAGYDPTQICATAPSLHHLNNLHQVYKIKTSQDNITGVLQADIIVLAVKPQIIKTVALEIATIVAQKPRLIISIAAGIKVMQLSQWFGEQTAIIRCMPNTPSAIGCGVSALYANPRVSSTQRQFAETIFRSVGTTTWIDNDTSMNVVEALSGSGPAYFFLLMEALEHAAVSLGLPKATAKLLTLQTALGSARMATELNNDVTTLRQQVTSPGGGTEQAIKILNDNNFQQLMINTLQAAKKRYEELSELFGQ